MHGLFNWGLKGEQVSSNDHYDHCQDSCATIDYDILQAKGSCGDQELPTFFGERNHHGKNKRR